MIKIIVSAIVTAAIATVLAIGFGSSTAQAGCFTVNGQTVCSDDIPDGLDPNATPLCTDEASCNASDNSEPEAPDDAGDDTDQAAPVDSPPDQTTTTESAPAEPTEPTDTNPPVDASPPTGDPGPSPVTTTKEPEVSPAPVLPPPGPPYKPKLTYCSAKGNMRPDGQMIPVGTFLYLEERQPVTDAHYAKAQPAIYVEGVGLTCILPPGFVPDGFAGDDQHVARGIYPYYVPGPVAAKKQAAKHTVKKKPPVVLGRTVEHFPWVASNTTDPNLHIALCKSTDLTDPEWFPFWQAKTLYEQGYTRPWAELAGGTVTVVGDYRLSCRLPAGWNKTELAVGGGGEHASDGEFRTDVPNYYEVATHT